MVEGHFSKNINQIEAGLPDIMDDDERLDGTSELDKFNKATTWTCPTCTNVNPMAQELC